MSALSVRISEDPARPLGHAIVTLGGLPRSLETFEFVLRRHGFTDNHLGPDGWQGAECWLQPQEVWYSGEALKFVIPPDLAFQLENMPYRLAVRGQGLASVADVTFTWPPQLEIEAGAASSERRVVGGVRVEAGPKLPPEPAPASAPLVTDAGDADLPIPDMPIPDISFGAEPVDENLSTRAAPGRPSPPPPPKPADDDQATRIVTSGARSSPANRNLPVDPEPTVSVPGRRVSPPVPAELAPEPPIRAPSPAATPGATNEARRSQSGLLIGLLTLVVLVAAMAAGGWWLIRRGEPTRFVASPVAVPPVRAYASPEPKPAPDPKPAPEPVPAPEPKPASEPVPAPEPKPAPEPAIPVHPVLSEPPASTPVPPATTPSPRAAPSRPPDSGRSLEDELKSQFDPTVQELEKRLHRSKSP
jgi:hypothetical protein